MSTSEAPEDAENERKRIGQELHDLAARRGLSAREIAAKTGVDRSTVSRILDGDPTVRPVKLAQVEAGIRSLAADDDDSTPDGEFEVVVEGNFNVRISVRGSASNLPALEATLDRLLRRMRDDDRKEWRQ